MGVSSIESSASKFFTKNSRVEVTSEEEGFTGAWFLAKIIDPFPKKKPNQVYIQYETLLDEKSSKPLKEFVNSNLVRPIPPQESEKIQSFQLNDVVDGFYKDGWWTGVITKVFDANSRFEVTFSNPPDLIEFGAEDLRVHRDWVRGKWFRPKKKQRITGLLYSKGKKVEVSLEKVGHSEVWFPAIVQEDTGNGSFLVEYQYLGKIGEPESVKVKVNSLHIRPSPPQLKGNNYVLLEKVDAYIDFGWWSGVLTKELPDHKYLVFFKETKKESLVNQSEIRPHMEWKEGNWFSTSQVVSTSLDYQGSARNDSLNVHQTEMVSPGSLGALKGNSEERTADSLNSLDIRMERSTPSSMEPSTIMTSQKKKAKLLNAGTAESTKKMEHANNSDLPLLPADHLNSSPIDAPGEEIHFSSPTSTNGGTGTNNSEQSMVNLLSDNFSCGKRARTKRHKPDELEHHTPKPLRRSAGRRPKSRISETQDLAGDKRVGELDHRTPEPLGRKSEMLPISQMSVAETPGDKNDNAVKCTEENLVQKECGTEVPITRNPEKVVVEGSQAEVLPQIPTEVLLDVSGDQEQLVHDPPVDGVKEDDDDDQLEGRVESTGKRKRGRPPKLLQKSPEVGQQKGSKNFAKSPEVTQWNGGDTAEDMTSGEVVLPVVVGLEATKVDGSLSNKEKLGVDKKILNGSVDKRRNSRSRIEVYRAKKDKLQSRKGVQASVEKHEKDSLKRGRRRTLNINAGSPNQDSEDTSVGKMIEVNGKDSLVKEAETSTVRLPFNMSDDEPLSMWLEAPKTADATSASQGRDVEQQRTTSFSQDIVMIFPQCNDQSLPFAKSSSLWKTIESMQVFRLLPQKPHFQSLFSKKESSREGLAIALMVDFANVVEKTSTLQFDGPRNVIEDYLETLLELEDNGFDVNVVRDRLKQLLLIKQQQEELEGKAKESTEQIKEENHDKSIIDKKVEDIDNRIRLLQEERALALSTKVEKDSTIASLKSTVNSINDSMRNAHLEFEALVAAPWQEA